MRFTLEDLKEKGLHGDLNLSTGWNLGGKWIPRELSASLLDIEKIPLNTSSINLAINSSEKILSILAVDENNKRTVLDVNEIREGKLSSLKAEENWTLYVASLKEGIQKMRFPVPGEDGYTMDYLDEQAIKLHLSQYSKQLGQLFNENLVRGVFNDSWEVDLNWTDKLFDELSIHYLSDIPEADVGGSEKWLFTNDLHYRPEHFLPRIKFPLSAVNLGGKKLLSAEVFTFYGPHLEIDFEMLKRNVGYCLAGGVNQMFYHGMAYSPVASELWNAGFCYDFISDRLLIDQIEVLESNLPFIRKRKKKEGWFKLDVQGKSVVILDPMLYKAGIAQSRKSNDKKTEVYLSIAPNKSYILKISDKKVNGNKWKYETSGDKGFTINSKWSVSFVEGGDVLPDEIEVDSLHSWTKFHNSHFSYKYFSGTANYLTTFTVPKDEDWEPLPSGLLGPVVISPSHTYYPENSK